jgi:lipoprotein signal peptidase
MSKSIFLMLPLNPVISAFTHSLFTYSSSNILFSYKLLVGGGVGNET